jgi:hypothetical protein
MAEMSAISMVVMVAAAAASAAAQKQQADAQANMQNAEAASQEQRAGQERAAAQRVADQKRKEGDRLTSVAQAGAAASGGGVDTPGSSITEVMGDVAQKARNNADVALYEGEEKGRGLEYAAAIKRTSADAAIQGGNMGAFATVLKGVGGLAGGGKPGFSSGPMAASNGENLRYGGGPSVG